MHSYILYSLDRKTIVSSKSENRFYTSASLIKVLYALDLIHLVENNHVDKNKKFDISEYAPIVKEISDTNLLKDLLLNRMDTIKLDIHTLIHLMLKHSCNGTTRIIKDLLWETDLGFKDRLNNIWKIGENKIFDNNGQFQNFLSALNVLEMYKNIYEDKATISQVSKNRLKLSLSEGTSRYSIFDQKSVNIKILGCKNGQIWDGENQKGYYHGSGVFETLHNKKKYIVVVMTETESLPECRKLTRDLGWYLLQSVDIE